MPKYKIREIDNTGSTSLSEQPNIVYVPGAAKSSSKTKAKLYTSSISFLADIDKYTLDLSFYLALRLLKLGMQVVYQGFPLTSGEVSISDNKFTINSIEYTIKDKNINWTVDGISHSTSIDNNNVAELSNGLLVKISSSNVIYPVAVSKVSTSIEFNSGVSVFTAKGVEFTIGDNKLTYTVNKTSKSSSGVNGVFTISDGFTDSFVITLDYVHSLACYTEVYVSEGTISMSTSDWTALEDKNLYNVRFLTTGGYAIPTQDMISCAANRGDCVALIDHKKLEEYSVASVRAEIEKLKRATSKRQTDALSFAAAFTPWFTAELSDENGESIEKEVPASFGYLFAYARSVQSNPLWKAAAGVSRGVINELVDVSYELNNSECEMLGARAITEEVDLDDPEDNSGIAINAIAYRRFTGFSGGYNYVIYGNRTMHNNAGNTIATSFLNVRLLISEISKVLYDTSVQYTFEQNSDVLWFNFQSSISPLLDKMKSGEGIEDYRLDRVATTKKARLQAKLTITPIEAVEDFSLDIILEDSVEVSE